MSIQAERRRQIAAEATSKAEAEEDLRAFDIYSIGRKSSLDQNTISNAISGGMKVEDFTNIALKHVKKLVDDKHTSQVTDRFSMRQLILDKSEGRDVSGAEREVVNDEMSKERGREAVNGLLLPQSVFKSKRTNKRDLTVGVDSAGGYLVDDSLADLIQPLDPDLPMLSRVRKTYGTKPFSIPRKLTKTQAEWLGETGEAQEEDVEFDEIKQRPYNLVGWTTFSKELLMSSSVEVEELVRGDLRMALAIGAERALLKATGVNQPTGLEANSDIPTITRSSANSLTEDELLEAEESVLSSNAVISSPDGKSLQSGEKTNMRLKKAELAWIVSPKFRRLCKGTASLRWWQRESLVYRGYRLRCRHNLHQNWFCSATSDN